MLYTNSGNTVLVIYSYIFPPKSINFPARVAHVMPVVVLKARRYLKFPSCFTRLIAFRRVMPLTANREPITTSGLEEGACRLRPSQRPPSRRPRSQREAWRRPATAPGVAASGSARPAGGRATWPCLSRVPPNKRRAACVARMSRVRPQRRATPRPSHLRAILGRHVAVGDNSNTGQAHRFVETNICTS